MKHNRLVIGTLLFSMLYVVSLGFAQSETDWPKAGYSVYLDNDGDTVIIRNATDEYVGRMTLYAAGADYHYPSNVESSYLFDTTATSRLAYDDANKNAIKDGAAENFNQYADGPLNLNTTVNYAVYGSEYDGNGALTNGYVKFSFTSPYTLIYPPFEEWFVVGLVQKQSFSEPINIENSTISFDLMTTRLTADVEDVLTVEVWAKTYNPNTGDPVTEQADSTMPAGYLPWRLQNRLYQVYYKTNPPLYDLPANSTWQTLEFNTSDLIFNGYNDRHWYVPDFTDVLKCNITVLQVDTTGDLSPNDFVAEGDIYIDNIKLGNESDVISETVLDSSITLLSATSDSSHPSTFYPGDTVNITLLVNKTGDFKDIEATLKVYDGLFDGEGSIIPNLLFDSTTTGETYEGLAGQNQPVTYTFSFRIPGTAQTGPYYILGTMIDSDTSAILDTTGPDLSMDDTTTKAFIEAFTVSDHPSGSGPVAIFDVDPPVVPIEETTPGVYTVDYTLDASGSFHIESPTYEIVSYEWDTDNDGVFETGTVQLDVNETLSSFDPETPSFVYPISLRVSDNDTPANTSTITKDVVFTQTGNITITAQHTDTSSMDNAVCLIYDSTYTYLGDAYRRVTDASGQATWSNLPVGTYYCEIYNAEESPFDMFTLRIIDQLVITAGATQNTTLTTNAPALNTVSALYLDTGLPLGETDLYLAGTSIKLECSVQNQTDFEQTCSLSTILDRDKTGTPDITVNDTEFQTIAPGETKQFSIQFSIPEPKNGASYDSYYYAVRVNTILNASNHKTDYSNWARAGLVQKLPSSTEYSDPFAFSGYQWHSRSSSWRAGLSHNNTWLDNDGNLVLQLKDYSGVGAQVDSVKDSFHYGTYKVRLTTPTTPTELPYGGLFSFFFYWTPEGTESQLNEIDLELRTLDISSNDGVPSTLAAFSVHNKDTSINNYLYTVTIFCPVANIDQPHDYAFEWTEESVTFFIDGEIAVDNEGNPAIIDSTSIVNAGSDEVIGSPLGDRIPYHKGTMMLNHWCDEATNPWSGIIPQGTGDMFGTFYDISYMPAARIKLITRSDSYAKLHIEALDSTGQIGIYYSDEPDGTYTRIGGIETVNGQSDYEYIDTDSDDTTTRYYKLYYE